MSERVERDFRGHFVGSDSCQFFRTTDVLGGPNGDVRVSTVGEYAPDIPARFRRSVPTTYGLFDEIGWGRLYETTVFPLGTEMCDCGCGAPMVSAWSERDFGGHMTRDEATQGHEAMVAKWMAPVPAEATP
jgi:hypothetical protein